LKVIPDEKEDRFIFVAWSLRDKYS